MMYSSRDMVHDRRTDGQTDGRVPHLKIAENKNNPRELLRTLKSLGMPSKGENQSKISIKENGIVSFNSGDNADVFCGFFSNFADSL